MPLYFSVAMVRDPAMNRVFPHAFVTVAPTEQEAIQRAQADLAAHHPKKEQLSGSIMAVDPEAIREAYAELSKETIQ
jgi:alkanesulfonate monooxygenase SsuD/methylene tetrahydromethanopterin reductase-like flavin-dependent oxidoreductase (luciferase family)